MKSVVSLFVFITVMGIQVLSAAVGVQHTLRCPDSGGAFGSGSMEIYPLNSDVLIIPNQNHSVGGLRGVGKVYFFSIQNETLLYEINSPEVLENYYFASDIAVTDDGKLVVGCPSSTTDGTSRSGTVYVFDITVDSNGIPVGHSLELTLKAPNSPLGIDYFGAAVAVGKSGEIIASQSLYNQVHVFDAAGLHLFSVRPGAIDSSTGEFVVRPHGNVFGRPIDVLDNGDFVVGHYNDYGQLDNSVNAGSVYVFRGFQGANHPDNGKLVSKLLHPSRENGDNFGYDLDVTDTQEIIVGAFQDDDDGDVSNGVGAAYVYENNGTEWVLKTSIPRPDSSYVNFGVNVGSDRSGNYYISSANGHQARVSVFSGTDGRLLEEIADPEGSNYNFGSTITATPDNRIIISDPINANPGLGTTGTVYVFDEIPDTASGESLAYVSSSGGIIEIYDMQTGQLVDTIDHGYGSGAGIEYDPSTNSILAATRNGLVQIDHATKSVVTVGSGVTGSYIDRNPTNGNVYYTGGSGIAVIPASEVQAGTFGLSSLGINPGSHKLLSSAAYDARRNNIFVGNNYDNVGGTGHVISVADLDSASPYLQGINAFGLSEPGTNSPGGMELVESLDILFYTYYYMNDLYYIDLSQFDGALPTSWLPRTAIDLSVAIPNPANGFRHPRDVQYIDGRLYFLADDLSNGYLSICSIAIDSSMVASDYQVHATMESHSSSLIYRAFEIVGGGATVNCDNKLSAVLADPAKTVFTAGEEFDVVLELDTQEAIFGLQTQLNFDSNSLELVSAELTDPAAGAFFDSANRLLVGDDASTDNIWESALALHDTDPANPVAAKSGQGSYATLKFRIKTTVTAGGTLTIGPDSIGTIFTAKPEASNAGTPDGLCVSSCVSSVEITIDAGAEQASGTLAKPLYLCATNITPHELSGVEVKLVSELGTERIATTDASGAYSFTNLAQGTYTISAASDLYILPCETITIIAGINDIGLRDMIAGDIDGDQGIDSNDSDALISVFNTSDSSADLNNDGVVNIFDMAVLGSAYGSSTNCQ